MFCPFGNYIFLSCRGDVHIRTWMGSFILVFILIFEYQHVTAQSMEIRKTIREELLPGFFIANIATEPNFTRIVNFSEGKKDPLSESSLQFSILSSKNPNSHFFAVDETSGVVTIQNSIDREQVCSFRDECHLHFEVAARSVYGVFFLLVDFYVTIIDINDNPPEFTQPQFDLHVPENSDTGRTFQLPTAFDRDTGVGNGVKEYRILEGPPLFGLRAVDMGFNATDVFLTLEKTITREDAAAYKVLVGAVDGGLPPLTGSLTVEVLISDVNDNFPVFEKSLYFRNIPEDTGKDHVIEQVKATDADIGPNGELKYAFSAQQPPDDLSFFRIDPLTGEIFLTKSIESRTGDHIELVVEARDGGHPPKVSRSRVRIHVEDTINSMPDIIVDTLGGSKGVAEVSEYAEVGKVVAYISVQDPDSGDNGRTSCMLGDRKFGLVKLQDYGKFKAILEERLDREQQDSYTVMVSCNDFGFPSLLAKESFSVTVLDENDQKPVFSQRTYEATLQENNTVGALVSQVSVRDGDIGKNAEVWFDIIGSNKDLFDIDDTGKILAKVSLDREYSDKIVLTVVATDKGSPPQSASATVVITLLDVNDMAPEFSHGIYTFHVEENQPIGKFVGIMSASDKDIGNNMNISYRMATLRAQNTTVFLVGAQDGVIKTNTVFDRERKDLYNFIVLAVDKGVPALTGTASIIVRIVDVNDNDPYFVLPNPGNNSITIPHTVPQQRTIASAIAHDIDVGLNAEITYSINTVNNSAPFNINPESGAIFLDRSFTSEEVGTYTLILMASDKGPKQQRSTQIPLYIEVFFDNSTLLVASGSAGPSKEIVTAMVVIGVVLLTAIIICVTVICIKKQQIKRHKQNGTVPNSTSTSSTTKLQGGYYIAPGIRGSSSSFIGKQSEGTSNGSLGDGIRTTNPYVVVLSQAPAEGPSEVIEISRNGHNNGLNDTLNTLDLDQTDDGQFSTFKSHDDIYSPGKGHGSLRKQSFQDNNSSIAKKGNDTFDDLSCDGSTSDSGRGGSDLDVHHGAAAAKHDKARAQAATPISVKSGISHRLSPLSHMERTFATFRGESPSSFKFDSDSDTLTRSGPRPRINPPTNISASSASSSRRDAPRFEPNPVSFLSGPAGHISESDTETELSPQDEPLLGSSNAASASASEYSSREPGLTRLSSIQARQPSTFMPPPTNPRRDSEADHSDGGSNPSNSLTRRNHVPRLPLIPGIEFTHHAFGVPNRNSLSAFSNNAYALNNDNYQEGGLEPYHVSSGSNRDSNSNENPRSALSNTNPRSTVANTPANRSYGNVISELQESRPVSMEEDFLLPPYPQVDEDEDDTFNFHVGYTTFSPQSDAERALVSNKSRSESLA